MSPKLTLVQLRRPLAVWLAVLITLFAALAPTLSHALVFARSGIPASSEICTSLGPRWVTLAEADTHTAASQAAEAIHTPTSFPGGSESVFALDHCPLCLLAMERALLAHHSLGHRLVEPGDSEEPAFRRTSFFLIYPSPTPPACGPPARA